MIEIVSEIVKNGHAEELRKTDKQYEKYVSKSKENEKNEGI